MIGLLLASTVAAVALLRPTNSQRVRVKSRQAIGACCSECAAAQAAGRMAYGHTCTPCSASRICPPWSARRVDNWLRNQATSGNIGPACVEACEVMQPAVQECLEQMFPTDGYGDPIDWSKVPRDGSPLDLLRTRVTCRVLAGCSAWADMSEAQRWKQLQMPEENQ